jgi:16S rRNA (uracil1498-N3)-methyltransferase
MHRFYSSSIDPGSQTAELDESETRHLRDVLRLGAADKVNVFDGKGREFACTVESVGKRWTKLLIDKEIDPAAPESTLDLTLAVALTKGEKFELVIQKAVELGVNAIVPVITKRCDVKPADHEKRAARWRKIALEASKQSGRARLIRIDPIADLEALFRDGFSGKKVFFSERGGHAFDTLGPASEILAVIGPEGGWEDDEISAARESGFDIVTLGGRILRAETAAIAIPAVLQNRFGDLN